jgi:methyl-CpG-binding domain protein 2
VDKPQRKRDTGWLPPDWTVQEVQRKKGKTQGRVDVYFLSPLGKKYRSKVEVIKALQAEEGETTTSFV